MCGIPNVNIHLVCDTVLADQNVCDLSFHQLQSHSSYEQVMTEKF
jgi:hypothetical protein